MESGYVSNLIFNFVQHNKYKKMEQQTSIRTNLQLGIYKVIDPFVKILIKVGLTPNAVTSIGFVLNVGVAAIFILGAEEGNRGDLSYVGWAGGLILFAGLFDMLDGQVARLGNMKSTFGALYDSVLDRYSELIMFLGICYYLVAHHYFVSSIAAFIALIGSMMVSYVRARAEGLGVEVKGGLMQRPERVVTIGLCAALSGIVAQYIGGNYKLFVPGIKFHVFETISIFTIPLVILAVLTNIIGYIFAVFDRHSKQVTRRDCAPPNRKSTGLRYQHEYKWFVIGHQQRPLDQRRGIVNYQW